MPGILSAGLLAGCVSYSLAPAPRPPAPAASGPAIINITALSGRTTRIDFAVSLNPDCSPNGTPVIRINTPPSRGTPQIVATQSYPGFAPYNIHSACNKSRVPGTALFYTPEPDYLGTDFLSFEVINSDGSDRNFNVVITVK